ncbi:ABC drug exporter AbcA [Durotheca rogersii]|uniref:ABC drug exporter AbcA n=1 Tax=Durotheca rogersii TaxID=419775 RepID=UPI00221E6644|nr:ABC drug exporter AbcA [Durotheca rogersii]KAI5861019.1 ABC drug exporter AbcA [Durotheca rogersii]
MLEADDLDDVMGGDKHLSQREDSSGIGVSFRDLYCYGFVASDAFQETILSYPFSLLRFVTRRLRTRSSQRTPILRDFHGLILPGQMLLVLGRPGSGCSTFLKTLSGETRGFHLSSEDSINYQGTSYRQMHRRRKGDRIYLAELDVHFPELTLGQTLSFAASTRDPAGGAHECGDILALFSLDKAIDTRIGNAVIRGISGGEKRRTSIAEAFVGGAKIQCWDNSTRGLDSSTARHVVDILRKSTDADMCTVAMSLYQASEDMYKCFDLVTVLYEGRQIYYGPAESASTYFTALGFVKSSRTTTADFLTSLTNPEERVVREGYEHQVPRLPDEFAAVWRQSKEAEMLGDQIVAFEAKHPIRAEHARGKQERGRTPTYPLSIWMQVVVCFRRALQRLSNAKAPAISAVVANTILGLIVGSVFYGLEETTDSLQQRSIVVFFALMINAFAPAYEVSLMWAQRPIVEKHHRYAFYHPFTERLASLVCDLPTKFGISLGLHIPLYFLANLRRTAPAFFTYWLFMLANILTMSMLFRMIGSASRTREQTMTPVSILSLLTVIYTGFVVPPAYMVPWLGWFWRINPIAYTYESLMINELHNRKFVCSTTVPDGPTYEEVGVGDRICAAVASNSGQQEVDGSAYLSLKYGYVSGHLWRNLGIVLAMMIAFLVLHLLAAEFIPAQQSRGEVLIFRRKALDRNLKSPDEESGGNMSSRSADDLADGRKSNRRSERPILSSAATPQAGVFFWESLTYEVKVQKGTRRILKSIDGWVKPGSLTALMGVTGAGKTTLLNVLADRTTTGWTMGDVYVNGQTRNASFQRRMGYVQQEDIHLPTTTVREALQFSALLRHPGNDTREKLEFVEEVLDIMDMNQYADAVVGIPGEGLNIEQRKRLSIAVEMVARPELLLFLDEPTSGLDSQTAWSICTLLRKLADHGQTILCTIHQPSSQLFDMFDRLLLLDREGSTLFFGDIGPGGSTLINFFESHGARKCRPQENPAEWMLDVTGNTPDSETSGDKDRRGWPEIWQGSQERRDVLQQLTNLKQSFSQKPPSPFRQDSNEYAASLLSQLIVVSTRTFRDQWRDPVYLFTKGTLCIGLAFLNGVSFWDITVDIQGLTSLIFSVFLIMQSFSGIGQLVVTRTAYGREIFEARECHSKSYSWTVFVASNLLVEFFWQTLIALPMFVAWYYPTGLYRNGDAAFGTAERGGLTFTLVWMFLLWSTTLCQALAVAMPRPELAVQLAMLLYWLSLVFCGVLVPLAELPRFWIFMYRVSPLTYFVEGVMVAGLAGAGVTCSPVEILQIDVPRERSNQTCGEYLGPYVDRMRGYLENAAETSGCRYCPVSEANPALAGLGMDARHTWRNFGLMTVYVLLHVLVIFGFYFLFRVRHSTRKTA